MFELVGLKVRGFRGFVGEKEFKFDKPVILLFGENHRGKSSTLNAIEWCLFGDDCIGKKTGIRERIGWEICNLSPSVTDFAVTIEFKGDEGSCFVTRECSGGQRRVSGRVSVVLPNGKKLNGEEAENLIRVLFQTSFRDFMTTVYQHQEAIRAIVTEEPRERNEAIDRLLGLSIYRELLAGISNADLVRTQQGMEKELEDFRRRAEQSIHTYDKLIEEEKAKAIAQGIAEQELTERGALHSAAEIEKAVVSLAEELGVTGLQVATPKTLDEIMDFRELVTNKTDELWKSAPQLIKQQSLAAEQQRLASIKGKYDATKGEEKESRLRMDEFVGQHGDEAKLVKVIEEIDKNIGELEEKIRKSNVKANLVREGIRYLKEVAKGIEKERCPLCGDDAPELLAQLERQWEEKFEREVKELEAQKVVQQSELANFNSLKSQLAKLERDLVDADLAVKACIEEIATYLGREIKKEEDPGALIALQLEKITSELKLNEKAIAEKREKISNIYDQLARLIAINEILNLERRKVVVEQIWGTEEFLNLENLRDEASRFVEDVASINRTLAAASREEAKDKINAAAAALSEYFCCMTKHPLIPELVIEVVEDTRSGLNSYMFKIKDGNDPMPILSQGDLNSLALSLFLGLAQATRETQRFAFIMMDDPTQSLGLGIKQQLVKILERVANWRKLIIATPDNEFKDLIMAGITKQKSVYQFVDWNEKEGPKISLTA